MGVVMGIIRRFKSGLEAEIHSSHEIIEVQYIINSLDSNRPIPEELAKKWIIEFVTEESLHLLKTKV